jgi:iron-sulfur cluster assembly protein
MASFMAGLNIVSISEAAAQRIRDIVAKSDPPAAGLRVGVTKGGCAGMEYTFELAEAARPGDEVISDKGVTVFVEAKSVLFLFGTELDFKVDKLSAHFVFKNPNQVSACGCGESVSIEPVRMPQASAAG